MVYSMQENRFGELQLPNKPIYKMGMLEIFLFKEEGLEYSIIARLGNNKRMFKFFIEESCDSSYNYMVSELTFAHQMRQI